MEHLRHTEYCTVTEGTMDCKNMGLLPSGGGVQKRKEARSFKDGKSFLEEVTFGLKS